MSEPLTHETVKKVAALARLKLSATEVETFTSQLGKILEYVDILSEVDTNGVEPLVHAIELSNVLRDDEPRPSLPREQVLANAPKTDGRFFLVPQILTES